MSKMLDWVCLMCGLIFIFEREKLKINISSIVVFLYTVL
jgi:hypothetical protein